jgi:hypothetical protein
MAAQEIQALFTAIAQLTEQVQAVAAVSATRVVEGGGHGSKKWDAPERYKMLKIFDGNMKGFQEWHVKFRSIVGAGNIDVSKLMDNVESECTEDELVKNKYNELSPVYGEMRPSSARRVRRCTICCSTTRPGRLTPLPVAA